MIYWDKLQHLHCDVTRSHGWQGQVSQNGPNPGYSIILIHQICGISYFLCDTAWQLDYGTVGHRRADDDIFRHFIVACVIEMTIHVTTCLHSDTTVVCMHLLSRSLTRIYPHVSYACHTTDLKARGLSTLSLVPRKLLELHRPSTCDLGNNGVIHPVPQLCCLAKIWETYWRNVGSVTAICRISNSYNMLVIGNLPLELRLKMLFWMFAMIECLGVGNRVLPLAIWRMKQRAGVCRFHFGGAYCWTSRCSYLISFYFSIFF